MKKQILNLGKVLNKTAQKQIKGGVNPILCTLGDPCYIMMQGVCTDVCMHDPDGK